MKILLLAGVMGLLSASLLKAEWDGRDHELPNPAASNCLKLGGTSMLVTRLDGGGLGVCGFGGALIEEWTLERATAGRRSQQAVEKFLSHPEFRALSQPGPEMGSPAALYCAQLGGGSIIVIDAKGGQFGLCRFADESMIEEWTLFRGPNLEKGLAALLNR